MERLLPLVGARHQNLPAPLDFGWNMKQLEGARTTLDYEHGILVLTIEHSLVLGVSPPMLDWWFRNIGGTMEHLGHRYPRYRVWHPRDHIEWQLVGGSPRNVGVGSRFRIVEALNRDPAHLIDSVERVVKLDQTGIALTRSIAGERIFSLEHSFAAAPGGTVYRSKMQVGSRGLIGRSVFNRLVRPRLFSEATGRAWLRHNIEEVGNFEFFLPRLFASMQM